jgi:6-phosphogluconate dehydrogenase
MNIGIIGLGSMGYNLAKNLVSKSFKVYGFDKNKEIIKKIEFDDIKDLKIESSIKELCNNLPSPKIIMLSLPADKIDLCINELIEYLNPQDIIADLGNSLYLKSIDRHEYLKSYDICFLGVGVSGGPGGALSGPAIMVGGSEKAWNETKHIFNSIAASKGHNIACNYFGSPGSGHFIKLVHNGIEYALMETLAETTNILMKAFSKSQNDQSNELNKLLNTDSSSYLLEITSKVLNAENKDNQFFIDQIDSKIDQNGTGIWTINAALELDVSIPAIYSALSTRSISSKFNFNGNQETNISNKKELVDFNEINLEEIIFFNFACSLYQGLDLINTSNKWDDFNFNIGDVFKVWNSGCILQGKYLEYIASEYAINKEFNLNFLYKIISNKTSDNISSIRKFISIASKNSIPSPVLSANLNYFDLVFSKHNIGETIQLQRSFFGQHPLREKKGNKIIKPYWIK